jgi:hypothetical protein
VCVFYFPLNFWGTLPCGVHLLICVHPKRRKILTQKCVYSYAPESNRGDLSNLFHYVFLSTIDANVFLSENIFMSSYYSRAEFVIVTIFIENIDLKKKFFDDFSKLT